MPAPTSASATPASLVVVTGTGTSIGKTHVAEALLLAWRHTRAVAAWKPIESGVDPGQPSDQARLDAASTFPVTRPRVIFAKPVSPHLAARQSGTTIDLHAIVGAVVELRKTAEVLLIELPGGLFSPLTDRLCNADLAKALAPDRVLLVAADRLGVLHDVSAAIRAATTVPLELYGVLLTAPAQPDQSTGTNAGELTRVLGVRVLASLPRAPPSELARQPSIMNLPRTLTAGFSQ